MSQPSRERSDISTQSPSWQSAPRRPAAPVYSTAQFTRDQRRGQPPGPDPFRRSRRRRRGSGWRGNDWIWVILAGGMISVFACLIVTTFVIVRAPQSHPVAIATADLTPPMPTAVDARSEFVADGRRVGVDVLQLDDGSLVELAPWDGHTRYTIIIGGLDSRPDQTNEPVRTDSLMLLSLDPRTNSVGVLSVPRDLWVQIPGQEKRDRINRAYFIGESRGAGQGARLLQQTISWNLGMRVHNYALVDFQVLIDLVDLLGGVEVTIDYVINDERYPDMNYGYDPFYLAPGTHVLDGADALRFARTRHGNNDVRRAERQQQVLYGIHDRALSIDFLQLIGQAPALLSSLSENFQTGLDLSQIVQLAFFAKDISIDNITMKVMNFNYLQEYVTEEHQQQVLIPIVERLPNLLRETFGADYAA